MSDAATSAIKVLVIDDSNTIRRSAELFLRQAGYDRYLTKPFTKEGLLEAIRLHVKPDAVPAPAN